MTPLHIAMIAGMFVWPRHDGPETIEEFHAFARLAMLRTLPITPGLTYAN